GQFGWDDYVHLGKPEIDELSDRVNVFRDESFEGLRHPFGATLQLTAAGMSYALRIPDPSGEPDTFPQSSELAAKFKTLAGPVLNADADELFQKLQSIPTAASIRQLFS